MKLFLLKLAIIIKLSFILRFSEDNKKNDASIILKGKAFQNPRQFLAWRVFLISEFFLLSPCSQSSRLVRRFLISGVFSILRFFKFILP